MHGACYIVDVDVRIADIYDCNSRPSKFNKPHKQPKDGYLSLKVSQQPSSLINQTNCFLMVSKTILINL